MRPFLRNLRTFNLQNRKKQLKNIFEFYKNDINSMKALTIDGTEFFRECLRQLPPLASNITDIHLINIDLMHYMVEMNQLFDAVPNLQRFVCSSYCPNEVLQIGERLAYRFRRLKCFGLLTHRFNCSTNVDQTGDDLRFNILNSLNFLRGINTLNELEIGADCDCKDVHNVLQHVPNIKVFSIWQIEHMFQESVEIRRIVKAIKEIINHRRNRFPEYDHVRIIVSRRQYREFKAIKHIDHFIRLTINDSERSSII